MLRTEDGQIKEGEIKRDACEDWCGTVVQGRAAHVVVIRGRDLPHKQPSVPQVYWQGSNINLWSVSQEGAYLSLDLVFHSWGPPPSPAPRGLLWQGGNCRRCDGLCGKEGSRGAFEIKDGKESAGSVPDNNPVFDRGYPLILLILLRVCLTQQAGLQIITHTFTIFTICQIIKRFFITYHESYDNFCITLHCKWPIIFQVIVQPYAYLPVTPPCRFKHPTQSHRALVPAPSCRGHPGAGGVAGRGAADEEWSAQDCSLRSGWTATAPGPEGRRRARPHCCHPGASAALMPTWSLIHRKTIKKTIFC